MLNKPSNRRPFIRGAALLLAAGLSACGFHLRGTADRPAIQEAVCVVNGGLHGEALADIRRGLIRQGVEIAEPCPRNALVLTVKNLDSRRRVLSVGGTGRALEYELTEALSFGLNKGPEQVLVPEQRIEVQRDFLFDETEVLAKANEETELKRRMRDELAGIMLRRIRAVRTER